VAPSAAPPLFVPETRVEAPAKKESPAPATPAAAPPSSEAEKPAAGGVDWKAAWLKMKRGPVDDKILLDMGMSHLKAKDYKNAASMLDDLIQHFPTSQYREEAMWLRGVALWAMEEHYLVYEQYEEFIITYAGSPHYLDALMKEMEVAEKFLTGTHRKIWGVALLVSAESEGLEILRKVYEHQPTGDLAPKIVARIADYHWGQRAWNDAEDYYDKYCREFPNGPDVRRAELLRAKCAIERCRGSRYDTTCLQLAYDRLKQFQQKYPQEAEQENVAHLLEQVRDTQAMGLYEAAAHYMRTNRPEAAAHYVETLEARFPDTPWAEQARRLLPGPSLKQEHEP
jgi:outer membrane protein assembly factor BamD (BamD/ComL family)